jgi:hypothetical protein
MASTVPWAKLEAHNQGRGEMWKIAWDTVVRLKEKVIRGSQLTDSKWRTVEDKLTSL